jgi:hypothetical protein
MRCKPGFLGVLLWTGVWSGVLSAQTLVGPVEAFSFDAPTRSLRAVNGSLGSASLGPALYAEIDFASVAPHQNYAVAFRSGRGMIVSGLGSASQPVVIALDSAAVPEGVAWSGDGSSAILFSRSGNWIQKLTGLPASPTLGPSLSTSLLGGSLLAVASDSAAAHVAIGMAGSGVFEMTDGQGFVPLVSLAQPISLAFSDDDATLYGIDGASHQLSEVRIADFTSQSWALDPLQDPIAVRSATGPSNAKVIYVAGRSDRLLIALDASSHQTIASIPLSFQPTLLDPLGRRSFTLGSRLGANDTFWSLMTSPQASVYFVPATPLTSRMATPLPVQEDFRK